VSSCARPFVVRYISGLGPDGLGWVMGPEVYLAVGWIGLGQLFGGLGWVWVDEMDPWTTPVHSHGQQSHWVRMEEYGSEKLMGSIFVLLCIADVLSTSIN